MIERQEKILRATILDHIQTAEPVGSKALADQHQLTVSSATIRNDLKMLEEEGYLTHLHTSSGRVPTDKGYRYYVDTLMHQAPTAMSSKKLALVSHDLKSMYSEIAQLMSDTMPYASLVVPTAYVEQLLRVVHMMVLGLDRVLVVVLHSAGVNEEFVMQFKHHFSQTDFDRFSRILSERLQGRSIHDLSSQDSDLLVADFPELKALIRAFIVGLDEAMKKQQQNPHLHTAGMSKLLDLPEFENLDMTRSVIGSLENAQDLLNLVQLSQQKAVTAYIGSETQSQALAGCSFVTAPIRHNDQSIASIGILGPKRLMYRRVLPYVEQLAKRFSSWISRDEVDILNEVERKGR